MAPVIMKQKKIILSESEMPTQWYNVLPDIPNGIAPPLDPETKQPMGPEKLAQVFPIGLLEQEMSDQSWVDIPDEIREIYKIWRPAPLVRADQFELEGNWRSHYLNTAEEILTQTGGSVNAFCDFVGSGGSYHGISKRLVEFNPSIKCYVVEPETAAVLADKVIS